MRFKSLYANIIFLLTTLCFFSTIPKSKAQVSAIYAGGPIYYTPGSIQELRESGYTTVIVWTIHIEANGDLGFNGEFPLVQNGVYVGDDKYPEFPANIALLKAAPTSIQRVEFGLSAAGSGTFEAVKNFYETEGFGPESTLYRNFAALKAAIPHIDAFNNDDESTYDVNSAVAFTKMLAELWYQNAIVPYTRSSFWNALVSQVNAAYPGNIDRNYLQCYAGGSFNNPCSSSWDFGIPVYPGLWGGPNHSSVSAVSSQMNAWQDQCGISGGFMWIYDDFDGTADVANYANAINEAFAPVGIPSKASNPSPTSGSTNNSLNTTISWTAGNDATSHKVYLSTNATITDSDLISTQSNTSYNLTQLSANTTYYWRVDETNSLGTTIGDVWNFTTAATDLVDYTDPVGSGIIQARAEINSAESATRAFDNLYVNGSQNSDWSKWLDNAGTPTSSNPSWIQIQLPSAANVNQLTIVSGNDFDERDPQDFNLQGSNDGNTWTTLANWTGQAWTGRLQRKDFSLSHSNNYTYFRLNITQNKGDVSMTQLTEIMLWGNSTPPTTCSNCIDFNALTISSYANQDANGAFSISNDGSEIQLNNNTWKASTQTFNITSNTVVTFEFKSNVQGEIHGIGFDEDNSLSSNRIFKVHGSQNWGVRDYDTYDNSGNYTTYSIPVGNYYTGNSMRLVLVNDYDAGSGNNSYFKNVSVYENTGSRSTSFSSPIINEQDDEDKLQAQVFPNPFTESIQIIVSENTTFTEVQLLDITGKSVLNIQPKKDSKTLSIASVKELEKGMYILKLIDQNNRIITHKLIKE